MYEIAMTFWIALWGVCLVIALMGGVADALLRSGRRVGSGLAMVEGGLEDRTLLSSSRTSACDLDRLSAAPA
ncbi:MAG: hypothetical protein OXR73_11725 [Myxococcales bacterium]|nr:hypothetical protein [Myxococcales bacterium]